MSIPILMYHQIDAPPARAGGITRLVCPSNFFKMHGLHGIVHATP